MKTSRRANIKVFSAIVLIAGFCLADVATQTKSRKKRIGSRPQAVSLKQNLKRARAVIFTSDIGAEVDDQWTLAQLALAPEFDLRGVVTTHAPSLAAPAAETSAKAARETLDYLPLVKKPSVFAGSSVPLAGVDAPQKNRGVEFILQQAKSFSSANRLIVLITGAATDVASALLIDPALGNRIEIVAMGFDGYAKGGDSWNVKNDVRAWQIVLRSRAPVIVGDAAVTLRDLRVARTEARDLLEKRGAAGKYLADLHARWLERDPAFVEKVTGSRETWIIWDSVTLAYLLGFTRHQTFSRPVLRDDLSFEHSPQHDKKQAKIVWITAVDSEKLWKHFTKNLDIANAKKSKTIERK